MEFNPAIPVLSSIYMMKESPGSHHHHNNFSLLDHSILFNPIFSNTSSLLSTAFLSTLYLNNPYPHLLKPTQWRTNAPVTPLPSPRPATATSSPGTAMTAPAVHSRLSGSARSVATSAATAATNPSHKHICFDMP